MAKQHPLQQLVGKTIKKIKVGDINVALSGHQFYGEQIWFICEDGNEFAFIIDGGCEGRFYAHVVDFGEDLQKESLRDPQQVLPQLSDDQVKDAFDGEDEEDDDNGLRPVGRQTWK